MSAKERPEVAAFRELEALVRSLNDELAATRRRVETQTKEAVKARAAEKASALESENGALKTRLGRAADRVKQMIERVRFLRQQLQAAATEGSR